MKVIVAVCLLGFAALALAGDVKEEENRYANYPNRGLFYPGRFGPYNQGYYGGSPYYGYPSFGFPYYGQQYGYYGNARFPYYGVYNGK